MCFSLFLGIAEAQVMLQLDHHLQNLEAEKHKLFAQVKLLSQENAWLRDELGSAQRKVHQCEQINTSYSVQIEHLKFLKETQPIESSINEDEELIDDLFPVDEHVQPRKFDSYHDLLALPSHSGSSSDIPMRLKTLHNLVIQYASQGRYEIAIPLCRQALEDLEKTSGHLRKKPSIRILLDILLFRSRCCNHVEYSRLGLS